MSAEAINDSFDDLEDASFISKHKRIFRYLFIPFLCISSFGSYYCFDIPGAIQNIMKADLNINSMTFMGFYTWYSIPNVILCFVGSFAVDRFIGLPIGGIVCIIFLIVGQIIFATGGYLHIIWLMYLGRLIFGIGGETLSSVQNSYSALWFKGKELNFVFGLQLSFARVGSTAVMKSMNYVYEAAHHVLPGYHQLGVALYLAAFVCLISLTTSIVMAIMTRLGKRHGAIQTNEGMKETYPVSMKDVLHFGTQFWLITTICCTFYVAILPFVAIALSFYQLKYELGSGYATTVNSLIYLVSALASPLIGVLIDKTGRNLTWVILAILLAILSTFLFTFTFVSPLPIVIMLGISYSLLAASLWPMVVYIVRPTHLTTAYGVLQSIQNLGLAGASYGVGAIVDKFGYFFMELFFLGCLFLALLASVGLFFANGKNGVLNANASEILVYLDEC